MTRWTSFYEETLHRAGLMLPTGLDPRAACADCALWHEPVTKSRRAVDEPALREAFLAIEVIDDREAGPGVGTRVRRDAP